MPARMPDGPPALGLGVGLDLRWGGDDGIAYDPLRGEMISDKVVRFLEEHRSAFGHLFVSWQPKDRGKLAARNYYAAYDDLFGRVGEHYAVRALHHTALNLAAIEPYERSALLAMTNDLIGRYRLAWVNEDLGLWSLNGKPLPYPLAPFFTEAGLRAAIANTREVSARLDAPLLIEFPGFSQGTAFFIGELHAYDFFRAVAEEADVAVTLDTGHLLSYQWLLGKRSDELFGDLQRLPLARCFEIHLSGCAIREDRFFDLHRGPLLTEQLELLRRLLDVCPNARAVTYEDPTFDAEGKLSMECVPALDELHRIVSGREA
jgi:uncharacterized protein (UPF0276 family)